MELRSSTVFQNPLYPSRSFLSILSFRASCPCQGWVASMWPVGNQLLCWFQSVGSQRSVGYPQQAKGWSANRAGWNLWEDSAACDLPSSCPIALSRSSPVVGFRKQYTYPSRAPVSKGTSTTAWAPWVSEPQGEPSALITVLLGST